ncbi:MAG: cobalamin-dependent protein [Sedimentisphaerales bacterium]|nr:cobalamin-dependent protein [Sedimentisphaerales bacterium]MBN2843408.1 cobalamin-dependent protein [Sedimentisphaerales bacterium]
MNSDMHESQEYCLSQLLAFLREGDRESATNILKIWGQKQGYHKAISDILEPALTEFGKDWSISGKVSLGQAYVLGKVTEDIFELTAGEYTRNEKTQEKGPVIIGNIEGDTHALGRKLVTIFLKLEGWQVIDLGNDITATQFVDAAERASAPIIGVSAMMLRTAMNISKVRAEIDKRGLTDNIRLAVGGAVFCQRPGLIHEIGGDGTAGNAIKAPALFDQLLHYEPHGEVILL